MRVEIRHRTVFRFAEPASHSIHHARLTPRLGAGQRLINWTLRGPGSAATWRDGYGNQVTAFTVTGTHREVAIDVAGAYEWLAEATYLRHEDPEPLPDLYWMRNHGLARHTPEIAAFVAPLAPRAANPDDRVPMLHDLMRRIHETVEYRLGESDVTTPAAEVLARRAGVCQDHAHLFIACCRSLGVPARYVSGYMSAERLAGRPPASHGWAEAQIPYLGWVGFDPANSISPTGDYLKLAVGLDYVEAAPVTGRRVGLGDAAMEVSVTYRRMDEAATNQ